MNKHFQPKGLKMSLDEIKVAEQAKLQSEKLGSVERIQSLIFLDLIQTVFQMDNSSENAGSVIQHEDLAEKSELFGYLWDFYVNWMKAQELISLLIAQRFAPAAVHLDTAGILDEIKISIEAEDGVSISLEVDYLSEYGVFVQRILQNRLIEYREKLDKLIELSDRGGIDWEEVNDEPGGPDWLLDQRDQLEYVCMAFILLTHRKYLPFVAEDEPHLAHLVGQPRFPDVDIKKFTVELRKTDDDLRKLLGFLVKNKIVKNLDDTAPDTFWWRHRKKN